MKRVKELFENIEAIKVNAEKSINDRNDMIDKELEPFFDDNTVLKEAIKDLEKSTNYQWNEGGEIDQWMIIDLSEFQKTETTPCLLDALERYLNDKYGYIILDRKNDCILQGIGPCIIINEDGDVYDMELPDKDQFFLKSTDYEHSNHRNYLIECHMQKQGCFPGVFEADRYGYIRPVDMREAQAEYLVKNEKKG